MIPTEGTAEYIFGDPYFGTYRRTLTYPHLAGLVFHAMGAGPALETTNGTVGTVRGEYRRSLYSSADAYLIERASYCGGGTTVVDAAYVKRKWY